MCKGAQQNALITCYWVFLGVAVFARFERLVAGFLRVAALSSPTFSTRIIGTASSEPAASGIGRSARSNSIAMRDIIVSEGIMLHSAFAKRVLRSLVWDRNPLKESHLTRI
jgi:hypothetical protein